MPLFTTIDRLQYYIRFAYLHSENAIVSAMFVTEPIEYFWKEFPCVQRLDWLADLRQPKIQICILRRIRVIQRCLEWYAIVIGSPSKCLSAILVWEMPDNGRRTTLNLRIQDRGSRRCLSLLTLFQNLVELNSSDMDKNGPFKAIRSNAGKCYNVSPLDTNLVHRYNRIRTPKMSN